MTRKIKVLVRSADHNVILPAIPLKLALPLLNTGLWGTRFVPESQMDESVRFLVENQDGLKRLLQMSVNELCQCEPFTLVEVESGMDYVRIDIV